MPRGKRLTGKFHFTKLGIICLTLALGLGMLGVNFAHWSESLAEEIWVDTSGSQPIEPGMTFGDLTVVEVKTVEGEVTFLTLQYDGDEAAFIEVKAGEHVLFEGGGQPKRGV